MWKQCLAGVVALAITLPGQPAAAAAPAGIYAGMDRCPLTAPALRDPADLQVGCVVSVTRGGRFTIGATTVALTEPITLQFGVYWPAGAPTVEFPDGTVANVFSTVPPATGKVLTTTPLQVPIPGLANFLPGVTSVFAQVETAGPITDFVPLAIGEAYPVFRLPIRLHLYNALFGLRCTIGPISLQPVITDPGTVDLAADPNGFDASVVSFTGARLADERLAVPAADGCGLGGSLDRVIDAVFGLPSPAGHNAVVFSPTNTSLAVDASLDDLTKALAALS
jgi:hypothetical protein